MSAYVWKTYDSADGNRRVFFDKHIRLWTLQSIDSDGNQTPGECQHTNLKWQAMEWLAAGTYGKAPATATRA